MRLTHGPFAGRRRLRLALVLLIPSCPSPGYAMTRTLLTKLLVAAVAVVPAVAYLGYAGIQDGGLVQYHVPVDQYLKDPHFKALHVRLAGKVSSEGLALGSGRLGAQFRLEGTTGNVP